MDFGRTSKCRRASAGLEPLGVVAEVDEDVGQVADHRLGELVAELLAPFPLVLKKYCLFIYLFIYVFGFFQTYTPP
jgi:hypothetical protein